MKIGLYGTENKEATHIVMLQLIELLKNRGVEVYIYDKFKDLSTKSVQGIFKNQSDIEGNLDYVLSIGGDGTFLSTATLVGNSGIPVLGINTGRLGFLANVSRDNIEHNIDLLVEGRFTIDSRSMISLNTKSKMFGDTNFALNEIAIHKKDSASMVVIHVEADGNFLNSYWADGLIISTPTGSTAYSMSCGGPILVPRNKNFIVTPKAAHHLNIRPIVVPDDIELKLTVEGRDKEFLVSLDSRSESFKATEELIVSRANFDLKMVKPEGSTFLNTMRSKLHWGIDKRNS
ncbi:MAG: NAD+ kinase [Patiriisocius sp.]|jgi:NAD+ kinase